MVQPLTYMNSSGLILPRVMSRFGVTAEDILVVFDQMDIEPGRLRMKPHGSSAGHNGLKSVEQVLGTDRYHRLAVGIGRSTEGRSVVDHVLGVPSQDDLLAIRQALGRGVPVVAGLWAQGWEGLIHAVNQSNLRTT